jgi:hypothetical protein
MARSATGHRVLLATAAGLVVGVIGAVVLSATDWPPAHADRGVPGRESAAAARRFIEAWRRSRTTSWVVDARFERVTAARRRLAAQVHMAQRPPDRLVTGLGAVDGRRGDRRLACAPDAEGVLRCREGPRVRPYDAEVDIEIRTLRSYVLGPGAFYAVREEGACFRLRLSRQLLSPPYGQRSRFCFDRATGAPVRSEVLRKEARDETVAVTVRGTPTEDDLDPEKWNGGGRG